MITQKAFFMKYINITRNFTLAAIDAQIALTHMRHISELINIIYD